MGERTLVVRLTVENSDLESFTADSRGRITLGNDYANETVTLVIPPSGWHLNDIQPFHVRHHPDPDLSEKGLTAMAADRRFGIHWEDQIMTSKWYYVQKAEEDGDEGLKADIKAMHQVSEDGGLVTVEYQGIWPSRTEDVMLLGLVKPNTPIEPRKYEFEKDDKDKEDNKEYMKTIQMVNVVEASKEEYPELWEKRPPRGSIRRWQTNPEVPREVYRSLR